jgi:hypothetical protein
MRSHFGTVDKVSANPPAQDWPHDVITALAFLAERLRHLRPLTVQALYVHGSLVLGDYHSGRSDIDFVAVLDSTLTRSGSSHLKRLHRALRFRFPGLRFNGCYVLANSMVPGEAASRPALYVDGLRFSSAEMNEWNEVTRFELATRAVPLFGAHGSAYVGGADPSALVRYVLANLDDYWVRWRDRAAGGSVLDSLAAVVLGRRIEWGVLGVSRQFYTLRERDLISKAGAAEYMLELVPPEHRRILVEALLHRTGQRSHRYVNWWARRRDALAYISWLIGEANG